MYSCKDEFNSLAWMARSKDLYHMNCPIYVKRTINEVIINFLLKWNKPTILTQFRMSYGCLSIHILDDLSIISLKGFFTITEVQHQQKRFVDVG